MKILCIVGARPQFIKLGPLSRQIRQRYKEIIIHTGQHFDKEMSDLFFGELEIPEPKINLGIGGGTQAEQTGKMLIEIEKILQIEQPNLVVVFGDTNSTLAGSIAAAKLGIKSIHVEAGLRSFNKSMPEEINRIISDHTSDYLFAPTKTAFKNLSNEGLKVKTILTGDIMVDSVQEGLILSANKATVLKELNLENTSYFLLTLHRPYNVDNPINIKLILTKLGELKNQIIFPIHPRTKKVIQENKIKIPSNILTIIPQSYLNFISLQTNASKIITDSGGVQKEAYILKKPCITVRSETEWVETVEEKWNILLDFNSPNFVDKIINFNPPAKYVELFGRDVGKLMLKEIIKILD